MMHAATGAEYHIEAALPDFPPPSHHSTWYLMGNEIRGAKSTAPAHTVWEDGDGNLFIRSMYFGDSSDWIGPIYGEKGIIAAMKIDYSTPDHGRKAFAKKFPAVEKRIRGYEDTVSRVSLKHQAALSLRWDGEIGSGTFRIEAKISKGSRTEEEEAIKQNVEALKAAWKEITEYNRRVIGRR